MKALVISGGGNKGAYAGGVAEFLIVNCGKQYDMIVGTSTGSLLAPLLALGKVEKLKKTFTSVTQKNIFKTCPFIIKKRENGYKISMNHLGMLWMFLTGKKTFGDSSNLRKFIKKTFTEQEFNTLKASGKFVVVTVSNLTQQTVEYKSSKDYDYEQFCDWIWASANLLPFMSLYYHDNCEYGDGGFGNLIPIQEAINLGATEIDVIALRPAERVFNTPPSRNGFSLLTKAYDFMLNQIGMDDLTIGQLEANYRKVDIHFYYTPRILTEQIFIFDAQQLCEWWEEGYQTALQTTPLPKCLHPKTKSQAS